MTYKPHFEKLAILALAVLVLAEGCVWGSVQYDQTLAKDKIKNIEPGETTRKDILKWFGPPGILARQDKMVLLPPLETDQEEMRKIDSRLFFKFFFYKHSISENHVVYYYLNEAEDINGISLPIPLGTFFVSIPVTTGDIQFSELWVLVNHKTGQVDDYVFLEREEK